jgi:phospholipase/carboxylesterase
VPLLPCVEVGPTGDVDGAVVWMHGLGASGHDFEDLVPLLHLPRVRFVFPHAPQRAVTINMGLIMPAWYDIRSLTAPREEDERGIRDSQAHVEALVAREKGRGVPAARIVLAGFSQGGAMALFTGVRHRETLAGIMVLSGYEVLGATREAEASAANRLTPLLCCHGKYDQMVPPRGARAAYDAYAQGGRPADWHEFPMGHEVCMPEVEVVRDWLQARLPAVGADLLSSGT